MDQQSQLQTQNIHQATYRLLKYIAQQMKPVSILAQEATSPNEPHPLDIMIELLRQTVSGIEQVHSRLENLEARLDNPVVARAIKHAIRG